MVSPYIWTRGLEKYAYSSNKKIKVLSYSTLIPRNHLYIVFRTWSKWAPGRWVLFVHCNPTSEPYGRDDPETEASLEIAQSLGFGGLGILYLFSYRKENWDKRVRKRHIGPGSKLWLRDSLKLFSLRIAAWGDSGTARDRDFTVWYKLRPMLCLGKTEKGNPISSIDYTGGFDYIKLLPFYINPFKRGIECDQIKK